jgi:putative hydrolase of the HAD superfamily
VDIQRALDQTEEQNLVYYGYGAKSFILSLIETAIQLTGGRIAASDIETILQLGKKMLSAEVELLEHVEETLALLARRYALMMITKGDSFHQEMKVNKSGLRPYFSAVEIVSAKNPDTYAGLMARYGVLAGRFLMTGNSLRSDILPVTSLGAYAVYIPYPVTWTHECVHLTSEQRNSFYELEEIGLLPGLLEKLEQK